MKIILALIASGALLLGPSECDGVFEPAPEKPWKFPNDPLPDYDPKNPGKPHRPPGHPGPKPKPKSGECNADTPLGCW